MTEWYKFRSKKFCFTLAAIAFCIAITWRSEARRTRPSGIYSTLTTDTTPRPRQPVLLTVPPGDSAALHAERLRVGSDTIHRNVNNAPAANDTSHPVQVVDTFNIRLSKDTLDAPVNYEAADSGVLFVKDKKFLLYGQTKTTYRDVILTAPRVELNNENGLMTAFSSRDSTGAIITRAHFQEREQNFQSDQITYNFKTKKGLTQNTYTRQSEMFVQGSLIKKVNDSTTFAKHVIMTTCDYDDPHFGFVANKAKFINGKVAVTGPIHPEFEGVPVPIYLPFGIFPLNQGRHSGLLQPTFTVNEAFGLGLTGLGYYKVINQYVDATLRTDIYSYGTWNANLISTYRKQYHYSGGISLAIQHSKYNFKGDPDYSLSKNFNISWNHSSNNRGTGANFSANVNAGSTRYNQNLPNDPTRNFQNQLASSIAYTKTWQGTPFNLTLSANHQQNNNTHSVNLTLPDAGFTIATIYPFERKNPVGSPKWYEKIGIGYNGVARNQVAFYDTAKNTFRSLLDTLQWGAQHRIPISIALPALGPLMVSPSVSYEETWLTHRIGHAWDPTLKKIDTTYDKKGLFVDRQMNFALSLNSAIYGMYTFKNSKIIAIRHVMRPTISFNYKPNMSAKYYDRIQVDSTGRRDVLPQIIPGMFNGYSYGRFGGITFGLDNNLEMKVRDHKDTTGKGEKKVKLIDGFGVTSGYNFLSDSLRLLPFDIYLRTTLFDKISITAQTQLTPYQVDTLGRQINKFTWQGNRFSLGRLNGGSISMSTNFQSKPRDPKKSAEQTPTRPLSDPNVQADQERLQEYIRRNPAEFVDFNIPWTLGLSFSMFFSPQYEFTTRKFKTQFTYTTSFNGSFSLTPKWMFTTNGYYDLNTMKLTMLTMAISRDMHCWQMSVNVTPIGLYPSFNITINPKSAILQDLRVNRTRTFYKY